MYASSFVPPSPSPQPHSFPHHHHPPSRRRPIPSCFRCCRSICLSRRRPFHRSLSPLSSFHRSLVFTAPLCSPLPCVHRSLPSLITPLILPHISNPKNATRPPFSHRVLQGATGAVGYIKTTLINSQYPAPELMLS
jgi:hypothetical protein